jgi:hypothetical protein
MSNIIITAIALSLISQNVLAYSCRNGAYISPEWIQTPRSSEDITAYVGRLSSANIQDYFIPANGLKPIHHVYVQTFLEVARKRDAQIRVHAMLGRRSCTDSKQKCFDAADSHQQFRLVADAKGLWSLGFDGVQLDLEPIANGNNNFLHILEQVRAERPQGKTLSLAGYYLELESGNSPAISQQPRSSRPLLSWSRAYYQRVLGLVDHVMVMNYDTAIRDVAQYRAFTAWQTREMLALAQPMRVKFQMGLPSDVPGQSGLFDRQAENLTAGSLGVADALKRLGQECPADFGIAVFTEAGLTPTLFEAFASSWASRPKRSQ